VTVGGIESRGGQRMLTALNPEAIQALETRMSGLQVEVDKYVTSSRNQAHQENESWVYLMGLLYAMQERIYALSEEQMVSQLEFHPDSHRTCKNGNGKDLRH
jgi:hypothetical protein